MSMDATMDTIGDFKSCQEQITSSLVNVTRSASHISSQDLSFHRSASEQFSQSLDEQNRQLLRLTNKLLKVATKDSNIKPPSLQDQDSVEDNWRKIVDVVDNLLEKADASLDEFTGVLKRLSPAVQDDAEQPPAKKARHGQGFDQWAHASMTKPQLSFAKKVDNYETGVWKPLLKSKPHAIVNLEESIGSGDGGHVHPGVGRGFADNVSYNHPYAPEIESMQYPPTIFQAIPPIRFTPPEQTKAIFVDTEEGVHAMLDELKVAKEIAVDLEHNDKNSYIGMVCLMQISTRNKDWIVDTLKPWRENLQVLNEVFADPKIVKVFHGSSSDIIWLQRDLGLYVVGLFDTYYASNALQFPAKSLKYLLHRFASFEAQKQFQLSDWRVRPLPEELLDYARSDTHYLLYIFDCLRVMLLEASTPRENLMYGVLESSKREALQVYERHDYDSENGLGLNGWLRMLMSRSTGFSNEQFGVFRALHKWRDEKARELDEGDQSIMPNPLIFTYAEYMPTRRPAFFVRGTGSRLPSFILENIPEICEVVKKGKEEGRDGPSIYEAIEKNGDKVGYMFGRNKYLKKKPEDVNRGIGATLQLLNGTGELSKPQAIVADDTPTDVPIAVRTSSSSLFGIVNPVSANVTTNPAIVMQALQSILPLKLSHDVKFVDQSVQPIAQTEKPQAGPTINASIQREDKDDIFTIKDRSRKRKAEETHMELQDNDDSFEANNVVDTPTRTEEASIIALDPEEEVRREEQKAKKAEKRAKKAAQIAERRAAEENAIPFDYANAESVLNAKPSSSGNGERGQAKPGVKPLNPFVKALNTSTGARPNKMGKELAGKSHTFTS